MASTNSSQVIEGTWEEIAFHASEFVGHRLRVTILPDETPAIQHKFITKGMFPQLAEIADDDFKIAEFHGDADDGLSWDA